MNMLQAVVIGVVQGITEWFPVSSSAHLVFAEKVLGIKTSGVALEVVLHLGTLVAAVLFYRAQWARILLRPFDPGARRALGLLVLATIPAAAAWLLAHDWISERFHDPRLAAYGLVACGLFLAVAGRAGTGSAEIGWGRALLIGIAQAFALPPGISRSGMTVGAGLLAGVKRERAVEFAFMMAVPAILGASLVQLREIGSATEGFGAGPLCIAAAAAFVIGYAAIGILQKAVVAGRISWFGYYCIAAGAAWALWLR